MPTKKVSLSIFLLVVFCINFIFYPIRDAVSEEEKSIPKAIPIPEPENENLSDAPRALPVQPPQDDDLEVPKAIPLNEKEIDDKPNEIKKLDNPSDTDIEEAPKGVVGVKSVKRELVFNPPFTMDMVPEDTKIIMGWA